MKILVCNPAFYSLDYEINPWMNIQNSVDKSLALKQWKDFVILLEHIGANVIHMGGVKDLPDIVFTANAGFNCLYQIVLSNFRCEERQPEEEVYKNWFLSHGFLVSQDIPEHLSFEGAGDVLRRPGVSHIFQGYGFRTDQEVYDCDFWQTFFPYWQFTRIELIDPYFYHLDTCFCPLPNDFALIYPGAFTEETVENLVNSGMELLIVPEEEAKKFACNAVSLGNNVIIPSGCPQTFQMLKKAGYDVYETDMSEYIKAGGACKCLTFKLDDQN